MGALAYLFGGALCGSVIFGALSVWQYYFGGDYSYGIMSLFCIISAVQSLSHSNKVTYLISLEKDTDPLIQPITLLC